MRRVGALVLLLTALSLTLGLTAATSAVKRTAISAPPTGYIAVNGEIPVPRTFATWELAMLPQRTISVAVDENGTTKTHTESGPLVSDVMAFLGWQATAACRNDVLRWWMLASNAKGATAVITRGEVDPGFGNRQAILSISEDGKFLTKSGPRLIVPGDRTSARFIRGVNQLTIGRAPAQLAQAGCDTTGALSGPPALGNVVISGDVAKPTTLTTGQIAALAPNRNTTVNFLTGTTPTTATEVGPLLEEVLNSVQPKFNAKCAGDKFGFYIVATGSDGYASLLSWGDIDASAAARAPLISVNENGAPLNTGPRVLAPGDVRGGRYVSGTVAITVLRAKPGIAVKSC